jgi:hypothetical protein
MFAIRTGNFQLSLMLAMALAVLVLPMAAEAYTPEGRQACTGDALRLCSAEIPNVDRVRACLHDSRKAAGESGICGLWFLLGNPDKRRALLVFRSSGALFDAPGGFHREFQVVSLRFSRRLIGHSSDRACRRNDSGQIR